MLTLNDYQSARRVLSSRDEFAPPAMCDYLALLEKESGTDFSALKKYVSVFLPFMNGAEHIRLRKAINRLFTRSAVMQWNHRVVEIITQRIDQIDADTPYDLIKDILDPLYMDFVERLFGVSLPDRPQFISQIEIATNAVERMSSISQLRKLQTTLIDLDALVAKHLVATSGAKTLFGTIASEVKASLTDTETMTILLVLLIAPRATTETLAHIIVAFSHLSSAERQKYADTEWVSLHVDDLIRLYASTNILSKEAQTDLQIDGCPVKKGEQVLVDIPRVNRDASIYQEQVCLAALTGPSNERKHLTFGAGPHICIGAEFAKDIVRECIPRLFTAFNDVQCDTDTLTYYNAQIATRIKTLTVTFR